MYLFILEDYVHNTSNSLNFTGGGGQFYNRLKMVSSFFSNLSCAAKLLKQ
jgi:hypothetical protein